jgi:beta-glucosidase
MGSKKNFILTLIFLAAISLFGQVWMLKSHAQSGQPAYRNTQLPVEQRVADLLSRMTLEEKVAQIRCLYQEGAALRDEKGNFSPAKAQVLLKDGIGELSAIAAPEVMKHPAELARFTNDAQRFLVEKTRLGIPVIFHGEALHGAMMPEATSFPQAIGLASTWDVDLYREVFTVAAAQARASGTQQVFTPVLDVAREPRWGRTEETYGEDPYLAARLGVAAVKAFQGPGPGIDKQHVIATLKHFAGYGTSEGGRNTAPANSSLRVYREFILPPFQAAIVEGGAMGVMPSYNEIDGIPSHANKWLLQKVLREEWGFKGIVVSDYGGVALLGGWHHIAGNLAGDARRALEAGVDVDTPEGKAYASIVQQVRDGQIAESTLDRAVSRILHAKFQLGLFEDPYVDPDYAEKICRRPEDRALALKAAHEAIILLKNQNSILPLNLAKLKSIAIIGPNAAIVRLGGYSSAPAYTVSILDGIKKKVGSSVKVAYAQGCAITEGNRTWVDAEIEPPDPKLDAQRIAEAVAIARTADVAIVAVGDNDQTAREGFNETHLGDRDSLDLVGRQDELVKAIVDTGKPTIVILIAGRPASIRYVAANVPAILGCWSLGQETGNAIADVLFGDYNPGGKLPITFPRNVGQLPAYYNHKPSATRRYLLTDNGPLFPFGYGLSYTTFKYDNLHLSPAQIGTQGQTTASVDVTNVGTVAGDEVVQMYIRDQISSVTRPVKELKGFRRITLAPGATKTVEFAIGPDALAFYNEEMQHVAEPGLFDVMVGGNSVDLTKAALEVINR